MAVERKGHGPHCQDCGNSPAVEFRFAVFGSVCISHLCLRCQHYRIVRSLAADGAKLKEGNDA